MLVKYLENIENFPKLAEEIMELISKVQFKDNQISCQGLTADQDDWHSSVGSLKKLDDQNEENYIHINKSLQGTVIESVITRFGGYRARIMSMGPRKCYSVHADPTPRIHVPIITNDQCWITWPYDNYSQHLVEGRAFWTDTTKQHSAYNGHEMLERIHLVMCVKQI